MDSPFDVDDIPQLIEADVENHNGHHEETTIHDDQREIDADVEPQLKEINHELQPSAKKVKRTTPLTLLTGWLGSGKTTFLHHILDEFSNTGMCKIFLNQLWMGCL